MATVPQQNQSQGVSTLPLIIFGVVSLVFGFLMWYFIPDMGVLPEAASVEAEATDGLFRVLMGIGGVVFFLVQGLIYYAAVAFRAKEGDTEDGPNIHGNFMLEIVWTLVPAFIVVFLAIYSFNVWTHNTSDFENPNVLWTTTSLEAGNDEVAIQATGQRYAWSFQYVTNDFADVINDDESITEDAGNRIVINTTDLYVYAGQNVEISMNTLDVIHSFWAPEMRVKQDLLPGRTTEIQFRPQLPTNQGWEYVMLHSPVTVYTAASLDADVMLSVELEEGALPEILEFELAAPAESDLLDNESNLANDDVSLLPEAGTQWVRILNERGEEGFIPISNDSLIARFNTYRLLCTELCGGGHGDMFTDIVMFENQEQMIDLWYSPTIDRLSVPAGDPFEVGLNVIGNYGCAGCHALGELEWTGVQGPSLDGLGARSNQRAGASGEAIGNPVDIGAEYIVQSLWRSTDYLVAGYPAIMPYFSSDSATHQMPREDLMGIVAYLCTQTDTGNPADSDCGFTNWEFDENGVFTGDVDALVEELLVISEDYE